MKRTFIALPVPPADTRLLKFLMDFRNNLQESAINWVDPSNFHITLAFIGDTEEKTIGQIVDLLQTIAGSHRNFSFILAGAGFFGSLTQPRVLWAGAKDFGPMQELYNKLKPGLENLGIKTEGRSFTPHLTIGRVRRMHPDHRLNEFVLQYKDVELQDTEIQEIIYYESMLTPGGAIYRPIARFPLSAF